MAAINKGKVTDSKFLTMKIEDSAIALNPAVKVENEGLFNLLSIARNSLTAKNAINIPNIIKIFRPPADSQKIEIKSSVIRVIPLGNLYLSTCIPPSSYIKHSHLFVSV